MKNLFRLILVLVLAGAGWWLWTFLFPSPEKVIRQRMVRLAETATLAPNDNPIVRAAKAQKLVDMFSPDAVIRLETDDFGGRSYSGRDEISEAAMAGFAAIRALRVEFLDVSVELDDNQLSATVSCTARVQFEDKKDFGVQEMLFTFKKVERQWVISKVETVKTLS